MKSLIYARKVLLALVTMILVTGGPKRGESCAATDVDVLAVTRIRS
jgi:hypothetical protein